MGLKQSGAAPHQLPSAAACRVQQVIRIQSAIASFVLIACSIALAGCGSSSSSSAPVGGSPVIVGSQANSLPAPPAQSDVNRYVALDVSGSVNLALRVSHPDTSYNYQQMTTVGLNSPVESGGVYTTVSDLLQMSDTTQTPYIFSGYAAEVEGGLALFEYGYGGGPYTPDFQIGVPVAQSGCLAPKGSVNFNFIQIPVIPAGDITYNATTDALYGYGSLGYENGVFSYSNVKQLASAGATASTNTVPFASSYCIQTLAGYGIESPTSAASKGSESTLVYLGPTGTIVGQSTLGSSQSNFVGAVRPSSPVDLSSVTKASYKGFYIQQGSQQPSNPAYFGSTSPWIATPVFPQTGTSLIGANESPYNLLFGPVAPIPGIILFDFGIQDSSHPGLFPSATIKEQDGSNLCPPAQQSIGPDGFTYCTFPVAALIAENYGKYAIFIAGPEPTTGFPLFYALVED